MPESILHYAKARTPYSTFTVHSAGLSRTKHTATKSQLKAVTGQTAATSCGDLAPVSLVGFPFL